MSIRMVDGTLAGQQICGVRIEDGSCHGIIDSSALSQRSSAADQCGHCQVRKFAFQGDSPCLVVARCCSHALPTLLAGSTPFRPGRIISSRPDCRRDVTRRPSGWSLHSHSWTPGESSREPSAPGRACSLASMPSSLRISSPAPGCRVCPDVHWFAGMQRSPRCRNRWHPGRCSPARVPFHSPSERPLPGTQICFSTSPSPGCSRVPGIAGLIVSSASAQGRWDFRFPDLGVRHIYSRVAGVSGSLSFPHPRAAAAEAVVRPSELFYSSSAFESRRGREAAFFRP